MTISIEALTLSVIIGILDFEREAPQKVIIDLKLNYDYKDKIFINYAEVVQLIEKDLEQKKYALIEKALEGIENLLLEKYPNIKSLLIKISKPNILQNCIVSVAKEWKL